jgi:hypothetical protein
MKRASFALSLLACGAFATVVIASPAATGALPLTARVLHAGDFPGYKPSGVRVFTSPAEWVSGNPWVTTQELRRLGFVAAAIEDMEPTTKGGFATSVLSVVVQFRSKAAASSYLARFVSAFPSSFTRFRVPQIPHAYGLTNSKLGGGTHDALFSAGRFSYDIMGNTIDPQKPPTATQVAAAALRLYRRVHAAP